MDYSTFLSQLVSPNSTVLDLRDIIRDLVRILMIPLFFTWCQKYSNKLFGYLLVAFGNIIFHFSNSMSSQNMERKLLQAVSLGI